MSEIAGWASEHPQSIPVANLASRAAGSQQHTCVAHLFFVSRKHQLRRSPSSKIRSTEPFHSCFSAQVSHDSVHSLFHSSVFPVHRLMNSSRELPFLSCVHVWFCHQPFHQVNFPELPDVPDSSSVSCPPSLPCFAMTILPSSSIPLVVS